MNGLLSLLKGRRCLHEMGDYYPLEGLCGRTWHNVPNSHPPSYTPVCAFQSHMLSRASNKSAVNYASSLMPELYFIENPIDIIGTINWDMKSLLKMTFLLTRKKKLAGLRGEGNDAIRKNLYQAHLHDARWLKAFKFFRMLFHCLA